MVDDAAFGAATLLPEPPAGWFEHGYQILMDGRLALIRTRRDLHAERSKWLDGARNHAAGPHPDLWSATREEWNTWWNSVLRLRPAPVRFPELALSGEEVRLSVFDGATESDVAILRSEPFVSIDRTSDGRWLTACFGLEGERTKIYAPDGTETGQFRLGEGVEKLLCSPDGTLWVGYNYIEIKAMPHPDGSPRLASGGVVQFDGAGRPVWSYNDHMSDTGRRLWACPAMTMNGSVLWAFHGPISRIADGVIDHWTLEPVQFGASALAVKNDVAVLAGFDTQNADRVSAARLDGVDTVDLGRARFEPVARAGSGELAWLPTTPLVPFYRFRPPPSASAQLLEGRDGTLHVVEERKWYRVSTTAIAEAADTNDVDPVCERGDAWIRW